MKYLILTLTLFIACLANAERLSPRIYNKLTDIQKKINEQPSRAQRLEINHQLIKLAENLQGNVLGLAFTWQTHAQLKLLNSDYPQANRLLAKAIKLKGLDSATQLQLKSFYAQVLFIQNQYQDVINILTSLINTDGFKPSASVSSFLAAAYYSIEDYKQGLPYIVQAITLSNAQQSSEPKEAWLQMAFSGYYQLKNYPKALHYSHLLLLNYPHKKEYWQQKTGLHQLMEDYPSAAGSKALSYKQHLLMTESDYISLAQLLARQGNAFKVATALERAMQEKHIETTEKSLRLMQQAWLQAKEMKKTQQALGVLFKYYQQPKDGIRLMRYLVDGEQWTAALNIVKKLQAMPLTENQQGNVLLLKGICQFKNGRTRLALNVLSKAAAIKVTSSQAKGWMNYIKQLQAG